MNINFENVPPVVFDWIETSAFADLGVAQQQEVLLHFTAKEYDELHQTCLDLKSIPAAVSSGNSQKRTALLDHFDQHHAAKRKMPSGRMIFWQAAAMVLLLLSGWLFYQLFDLKKDPGIEQMASVDTVFVTKEVASEPEIVHDTVYRYKEVVKNKDSHFYPEDQVLEAEEAELPGDIEAFPLMDLENLNPTPKGNTMKDDSLLRKFGFVSM